MIFSILITYTCPLDEVNRHLDTHKTWLVDNVKQGRVLMAGPLNSDTGGLVLAACADRAELEMMMEQDPFIANGVASYLTYACAPALASALLPAQWAQGAKFV